MWNYFASIYLWQAKDAQKVGIKYGLYLWCFGETFEIQVLLRCRSCLRRVIDMTDQRSPWLISWHVTMLLFWNQQMVTGAVVYWSTQTCRGRSGVTGYTPIARSNGQGYQSLRAEVLLNAMLMTIVLLTHKRIRTRKMKSAHWCATPSTHRLNYAPGASTRRPPLPGPTN